MSVTAEFEASILTRVLGNDQQELPLAIARYLLKVGFSERDKDRMHDLAVRNQDGVLSDGERLELFAFARMGTVLASLKSKARRVLKARARRRGDR